MRIRVSSVDDLETILKLNDFVQRQHAEALPWLFKIPTDSRPSIDAFSAILKAPDSLVLLAEAAEPAGYLHAQFQNRPENWVHLSSRVLYIHHLVIGPKFRRQGVGALLLSSAMEAARSKNISRVELDVWAFNNEARRFYQKHGFEVFNEKMELLINGG